MQVGASGPELLLLLLASSYAVGVVTAAELGLAGLSRVQQQNGRGSYIVPLSVRHGVLEANGRRLLKHGALAPVLGAVREGYFYAQLLLGTPPKAYSTIIDTGSSITYIPCSNCQHCGTHMATPFDPSKSSTARWLTCTDKQCQCGTPACSCRKDQCYYTRHYAEESSSEGWMVADKLHLAAEGSSGNGSNSSRTVEVVFGCENVETGEIYKQRVDGVLGMGNNANSLPRQLARSGVAENVFSLCYGFPQGGSMLLGDVALEPEVKMLYTPFVATPHNYYTVATQGINLGGKKLVINPSDFSRGYGTVLDSGTTFTYLPTSAYTAFLTALTAAIQPFDLKRASGKDPSYNDVCWVGAPKDWEGVNKIFPKGRMTFSGGAYVELVPYRYLFQVDAGQYCLGIFDNGYQGTLLGGIITRNVLVQYDKERNRAGFAHTDCNAIKPAAQAREISESSEDSSDQQEQQEQQQDKASSQPSASSEQQQQEQQQKPPPEAPASSQGAAADSTAAESTAAGAAQKQKAAAAQGASNADSDEALAQQSSSSSSGGGTGRHWLFAADRKLVWLGVAVGAVVVVAIVQLAFATLWQPPPRKGGSSGGGGVLGLGGDRRPYQAVGTSDDQELAELSERGLAVQNIAPSIPIALHTQAQGG